MQTRPVLAAAVIGDVVHRVEGSDAEANLVAIGIQQAVGDLVGDKFFGRRGEALQADPADSLAGLAVARCGRKEGDGLPIQGSGKAVGGHGFENGQRFPGIAGSGQDRPA